MATTLEIIQGLAQAASRAYDGAHMENYNDDGRARKAGLQREEGDPIIDSRVIDGFKVRFSGPNMIISYQSEIRLKEVYAGGFEDEINRRINEIKKFLQKEYKVITGESVSLTKDGESDILVQSTSRIRSWVQAQCSYKIGKVNAEGVLQPSEPSVREVTKKFLEQAKAKKPRNITRK
jgi:hypothetical protein